MAQKDKDISLKDKDTTPKDKDIKRTSSQIMELKDLISGPLAATIDADSIAARRYLSYLMELAFDSYDKDTGKVGKLRMLEFNYTSQDVGGGKVQKVSIPLLTLVPLPLLQVKEADFDFDIQIVDALSADKDATFSLRNGKSPNEDMEAEGVKLRVQMAEAKADAAHKSSTQQSLTANMRVKVRMEQADMPGGLANLLHLITNNMLMEEVEAEQKKQRVKKVEYQEKEADDDE